jgi:hypothetical protein
MTGVDGSAEWQTCLFPAGEVGKIFVFTATASVGDRPFTASIVIIVDFTGATDEYDLVTLISVDNTDYNSNYGTRDWSHHCSVSERYRPLPTEFLPC